MHVELWVTILTVGQTGSEPIPTQVICPESAVICENLAVGQGFDGPSEQLYTSVGHPDWSPCTGSEQISTSRIFSCLNVITGAGDGKTISEDAAAIWVPGLQPGGPT